MLATNPRMASLTREERQQLESRLIDFDLKWHANALAECLADLPSEPGPRGAALVEMVKIDMERQWSAGQRLMIEHYLALCPELADHEETMVGLIQAEIGLRRANGERTPLVEYAGRFPRHAPLLQPRPKKKTPAVVGTMGQDSNTKAEDKPANYKPRVVTSLPEQFGKYKILKPLGQGGMGSVYLAEDTTLARKVALKIPLFTEDDGPQVLDRFYREARIAANVRHPNLCPVFEAGEIDGIHYLTMEYIQGKPLSQLIHGDKRASIRKSVALMQEIALALAEAHRQGIVHRDLKPGNIMITPTGRPIIMDFGLARRANEADVRLTRSGFPLGSPAYMSPEQVIGDVKAMGTGCDIYGLGVILYEMLTGQLPFNGNLTSVLVQIVVDAPASPARHRPDIDPALEAIILKAMAKKIPDRFPSAEAFAQALGEYLAGSTNAKTVNARSGAGALVTAPQVAAVAASADNDIWKTLHASDVSYTGELVPSSSEIQLDLPIQSAQGNPLHSMNGQYGDNPFADQPPSARSSMPRDVAPGVASPVAETQKPTTTQRPSGNRARPKRKRRGQNVPWLAIVAPLGIAAIVIGGMVAFHHLKPLFASFKQKATPNTNIPKPPAQTKDIEGPRKTYVLVSYGPNIDPAWNIDIDVADTTLKRCNKGLCGELNPGKHCVKIYKHDRQDKPWAGDLVVKPGENRWAIKWVDNRIKLVVE